MEDRKSIIALILIGLILLLTPTYMKMMSGPERSTAPDSTIAQQEFMPVEQPENQPDLEAPGREIPAEPTVSESEQTVGQEAIQEGRLITVRTELYKAVVDTRGGVLREWELKEYRKGTDPPVSIIPNDAFGPVLEVPLGDGRLMGTDIRFSTDSPDTIEVATGDEAEITFTAEVDGGRTITRSMVFKGARYDVDIEDQFTGFEVSPMNDTYRLYWLGGLSFTEPARQEPARRDAARTDELFYTGFYGYYGGSVDKTKLKRDEVEHQFSGVIDWIAFRTKYFGVALLPEGELFREAQMRGQAGDSGPARMNIAVDRRMPSDADGSVGTIMYIGPLDYKILRSYERDLEGMMDFGWAIIRPIAKLVLFLFTFLHKVIPNYGIVIIIFSVLVKIVVFPLTRKSYESMHAMQELAPKMQEIREKYKDDPEKMNKKIMNLYKEHGVNPLGGCFPLLLQMPIFYALFIVLRTTLELRGAPFVFWIKDLSLMDPYLVLPGLMALSMLYQQRAQIKDPRQRPMAIIMPAVLFLIFRKFPAGLNLYWTLFNILSILQTELVHKRPEKAKA